MRTCPFDDCGKPIPDSLFACRAHWFSLTKAEQATIYAAYDSYLANQIDLGELRSIQQEVLGHRGKA